MATPPQNIAAAAVDAGREFQAIQTAIVRLAVRLRPKCRLFLLTPTGDTRPLTDAGALQARLLGFLGHAQQRIGTAGVHAQDQGTVAAWSAAKGGFFEVLCLLATLDRLPPARPVKIPDVFGRFFPIPISDVQGPAYLWFQPNIIETKSGLRARPDLAIARSDQQLDENTIVSVIECKWGKNLTAALVRTEFGKAFDLQVTSYTIVSYMGAPDRLKDGARLLGVDLIDFGLGTPQREAYLRQERDLGQDLAERLAIVRAEAHFASMVRKTADASSRKMLPA